MKRIFIFLLFLLPTMGFAADGDVIVSDLHDTSSINDKSEPEGDNRTIIWDDEQCADGVAPCVRNESADGDISSSLGWTYSGINQQEITIVWHEKITNYGSLEWSQGGIKSIRVFNGPNSGDYIQGSWIIWHGGTNHLMSLWDAATVEFNPDVITSYDTNRCEPNEDGSCTSIDNGIRWDWNVGSGWHEYRMWIKAPSTQSSGDGALKLWVDDVLHIDMYDVDRDRNNEGDETIDRVVFGPVDESATPHEHWYDGITIYEGYVPPDGEPVEDSEPIESPENIEVTSLKN